MWRNDFENLFIFYSKYRGEVSLLTYVIKIGDHYIIPLIPRSRVFIMSLPVATTNNTPISDTIYLYFY